MGHGQPRYRILRKKLTKASVAALKLEGERRYDDNEALPGFRLVVSPSGTKTFVVQILMGVRDNRTERTLTIGHFGVLTVEQARD